MMANNIETGNDNLTCDSAELSLNNYDDGVGTGDDGGGGGGGDKECDHEHEE